MALRCGKPFRIIRKDRSTRLNAPGGSAGAVPHIYATACFESKLGRFLVQHSIERPRLEWPHITIRPARERARALLVNSNAQPAFGHEHRHALAIRCGLWRHEPREHASEVTCPRGL